MVDRATGNGPAYYMINCAHPTHYESRLMSGEPWVERIGGMRANASRLSHAELDKATELDDGNPAEFGRQFADIRSRLKRMNVLGGCCGTDHRHIEQIAHELRRGEGRLTGLQRDCGGPGMFPAALLCGMIRCGEDARGCAVLPARHDHDGSGRPAGRGARVLRAHDGGGQRLGRSEDRRGFRDAAARSLFAARPLGTCWSRSAMSRRRAPTRFTSIRMRWSPSIPNGASTMASRSCMRPGSAPSRLSRARP